MLFRSVFIVEDDPIQQKVLQRHFENMVGDFKVRTFSNPEEILEHLHDKPFAIVLDHYFDGGNEKTGLEYLKVIKKKSGIPVIYYTSSDDSELPQKVKKLGAVAFIHKDLSSFVRLRTTLDQLEAERAEREKKGFLKRFFKL